MPKPLVETDNFLATQPQLSKVEFLPIPSIVADFQLNANTELARRAIRTMWREVVGLLRLEGLHKTFRAAIDRKPADGKITVIGKDRLVDGETFTLRDGTDVAIFEFDLLGNGASLGNIPIDLSSALSIEDVRTSVELAINGSSLNINAQPTHTQPPSVGGQGIGGQIDLFNTDTAFTTNSVRDAQNSRITDTVLDEGFAHRGMSGARLNKAIGEVFTVAAADLVDGETFVIPAQGGNPAETYEFDKDAVVSGGNFGVDISAAVTAMDVATALAASITTNSTDMTAVASPILAEGFLTAVTPAKLIDGETFTLNDGVNPAVVFEFDKAGNGVEPGRTAINISAATTMQAVRSAMINAINGVGALSLTASNPGFGAKIKLTNSQIVEAANTGSISHTIAHVDFLTGAILGFRARVLLQNTTAGKTYNQALSHTVTNLGFSVVGMAFGADDGWDITGGRCILEGYDVALENIPRLSPLVGKQNFLRLQIIEKRLTKETDPSEVKVSIPGLVGEIYGGNLYRWSASVSIVAFDAALPSLGVEEELVAEGDLCEFDAALGNSIVPTEVPIRVTKFNQFLEPQDVSTKVSKNGDNMTGALAVAVLAGSDTAVTGTGGPANGNGASFVGQGTGTGMEGISTGGPGVTGSSGPIGVKGDASSNNGVGVSGEAVGTNGVGVKGVGNAGLGTADGGAGVQAIGALGIEVQRTNQNYPHIRITPDGASGLAPINKQSGDLWVPASGILAGLLCYYNGTSFDSVRASSLGKVGNVQDAPSADKHILRYKSANNRWERVGSTLQEVKYLSVKDAVISVTNGSLGLPVAEINRGEISIRATGNSAGATLSAVWVIPIPPGWESWGTAGKNVVVVPVKSSSLTATYGIEVYDSVQAADHNTGQINPVVTTWFDGVVADADLTGNYRNTANNQGNMVVLFTANFGNGDTLDIGGVYIKSRVQNPFGLMPYLP